MIPLNVFIIQPFKVPYSDLFRQLSMAICADEALKGAFQGFHAIEASSVYPRLQDRINDYLKKADICVADLTGIRNENALLEVGAAYALGIPVIPFSDKELPADIRGNLYVQLNLERLQDTETQQEFRRMLIQRLHEAKAEIGAKKHRSYLSHAFEDRSAVDFYSLITRCERRLYLLTTNLNYIVNEDLDCGPNENPMPFLDLVAKEASKKSGRFQLRILALDPDSNFTNERALSLGRDRQSFREQMRIDLDVTKQFIESTACTVAAEVKIYDDYPLQMTFFFDDYVVSSVVAASVSSRYCVTYMHRLSEMGAHQSYEQHFDHLWGKAKQYGISQTRVTRTVDWETRTEQVRSLPRESHTKA